MTEMRGRPTAVTVIGWFWRVGGALGMVLAVPYALWGQDLFREFWPEALLRLSSTFLLLWAFFSSLLGLLIGNGILKGKDRARVLALAYCVVATVIGGVMYREHALYWTNLIVNLAFTLIMWFFLYRPQATEFFNQNVPLGEPPRFTN